ncbi:MAG: hypothetical protein GY862_34575 [Gammaproteobacteria bacterium]|nr:hypothetical protein [Gammaproteobacteria bacterium]
MSILKKIRYLLLGKLSIELSIRRPWQRIIKAARRINGIQLSSKELEYIIIRMKEKFPCNLLVFGLGNDSVFWLRINRGGSVVFIEDNESWFREILKKLPYISAYLVDYRTRRPQWKELLESPELLDMPLPDTIEKQKWDLILVDAPAGWNDQNPGRMKSIFLASKLAKNGCDVLVHDCNRLVEQVYCDRFLKKTNLVAEIQALRHYSINC